VLIFQTAHRLIRLAPLIRGLSWDKGLSIEICSRKFTTLNWRLFGIGGVVIFLGRCHFTLALWYVFVIFLWCLVACFMGFLSELSHPSYIMMLLVLGCLRCFPCCISKFGKWYLWDCHMTWKWHSPTTSCRTYEVIIFESIHNYQFYCRMLHSCENLNINLLTF
jgi:hypothetical protein